MGGVTIEARFDEEGEQVFFRLLDMAVGYEGMYTLVGDVADRVVGAIKEGFDYESSPSITGDGEFWQELAEFTIHERESQGFPGPSPINVRTGEMERALTADPNVMPEGQNEFSAQIPSRMTPGLADKLSVAQFGDVFSKTPARPVLPTLDDAEETVLVQLADASLQRTLNELFGEAS